MSKGENANSDCAKLMFSEQFDNDFTAGCTVQNCMNKSVAGISKNVLYGQNNYYLDTVGNHSHRKAEARSKKFSNSESLHNPRPDRPLDVYYKGDLRAAYLVPVENEITGNESMPQLKEKLISMDITNHGLLMNGKFDDNPILHVAHLTHDGEEVIIHDYS